MRGVGNSRKNELLKVKLSEILRREASPEFESVTIIKIQASPDLKSALVFYSCFTSNDKSKIEKLLDSKANYLQTKLGRTLQTRNTPKLKFIYDKGFDHSQKIEDLISKIHREENEN